MGFFSRLFGRKREQNKELAITLTKEYVGVHVESLMATWISLQEELSDFTELEKKDILKDEIAKFTRSAKEFLQSQKIKAPAHLFQVVREELNDKIIEFAKPHISEFVIGYRRPNLTWPHPTDVPLKDLEKLRATLKENNIAFEMLHYDLREDRIRSLLIQYDIRRKPEFQNTETWSRNFSYSHDDLILLGDVLKSKNVKVQGVEHVLGDLWIMVKQELIRQQDSQFQKAFLNANPDLPESPSLQEWAVAYATTFKNDFDYVDYVNKMARLASTVFEKGELEKLIREQLSGKTAYLPSGRPLNM